MALAALLFDCDGVIAETERDGHRVAFNKAFQEMNVDAYWDAEEYGRLVETGGGKERMLVYFGCDPVKYPPERYNEALVARLHERKTEIFTELSAGLPPRPGVARLMREAVGEGVQVFVCSTSNEKSVRAIVSSLLGADADRIITAIFAGDVVKKKKPAPDIYLKACEQYGLQPADCIVIEDTRIGLASATAAGMRCMVTVSIYSRGEDFSDAAAVAESLGEPNIPCNPIKGLPKDTPYITLAALRQL